jgi:hypothetical protein
MENDVAGSNSGEMKNVNCEVDNSMYETAPNDKIKLFNKVRMIKNIVVSIIILLLGALPLAKLADVKAMNSYQYIYQFVKFFIDKSDLYFPLIIIHVAVMFIFIIATFFGAPKFGLQLRTSSVVIRIIFLLLLFICSIVSAVYTYGIYKLDCKPFVGVVTVFCAGEAFELTMQQVLFKGYKRKFKMTLKMFIITHQNKCFPYILISVILVLFVPFMEYSTGAAMYFPNESNYRDYRKYSIGSECYLIDSSDDFREGTDTVTFYSDMYYYWTKKKADIDEEMLNLEPDGNSEDSFKKYVNQMNELNKKSKALESAIYSLSYKTVTITTNCWKETTTSIDKTFLFETQTTTFHSQVTEIIYDANHNDTDTVKWNNTKNKKFLGKQSITLSQTEFDYGTDFSTAEISAEIEYYDGSVKKCYITPDNMDELSRAGKGYNTIKWSDSWGSYEYNIKIV